MLLGAILAAGLSLALAAEDIITEPSPGHEYVSLVSGSHNARKLSHHDMKVYVKDEGTTGYKRSEKVHSPKKVEQLNEKKDPALVKAAVKDEGAVGAERKETSGIGVPPHKHISFSSHSEKPHVEKRDDSPDFDDDNPIVSAASSQSSRINVKKGPNGQEYEYEYVYYYYDDEEEDGKGKGPKAEGGKSKVGVEQTEKGKLDEAKQSVKEDLRPKVRQESRQDLKQEGREESRQDLRQDTRQQDVRQDTRQQDLRQDSRQDVRQELRHDGRQDSRQEMRTQELRQDDRHSLRDEPQRHRGTSEPRYQLEREEEAGGRQRGGERHEERGRQRTEARGESRTEEGRRARPAASDDSQSRTRYTTIERGRVKASDVVTTAEPSSNEVLPTKAPSRSRGQPVDSTEDERLPANARFPSRSRASAPEPAQQQPARSRGSAQGERGGSVRRPNLVDSSSFRTHGADAPAEEDKQGYLSSQLDSRESDFEEYVRPTTFLPPPQQVATTPPAPDLQQPPVPTDSQEMPAKAALDLYAILQQTQEENSVLEPEVRTTDPPTTEPPTTTTPEPTTTTTTTTTTTPPPTQPAQRGRFRGAGNTRSRLRAHSTTTTSTETPEEEPPKREKFKPSHNRNPGQVSAYGRRRGGATTAAPTTEAAAQQTTRARPSSFGSSNGNRYRTRGKISTTLAPQEDELSEEAEPSSTTSRPARARITAGGGARPLRPGPRLNLRPRPGTPAPSSPAAPEQPAQPEEAPTTPEPAAPAAPQHNEGDSLTKLRSRPRLKVQPAAPQPRPFSATNRRPLPGLRRRTTEAEVEAEATTPSAQPAETEPPAAPSSSEAPPPPAPENKLSSLIARRRPLARRIQPQPPADN